AKGAPDNLLDVCNYVFAEGGIQVLDAEWRSRIESSNTQLAGDGLRVLGVAFRSLDSYDAEAVELIEHDMVFIGLVGMIDPARPEVVDAVRVSKLAGIRPVMITGD